MQTAESTTQQQHLRERLEDVRKRIVNAAERSGRSPSDITLIAITKTHPIETVRAAHALGIRHFGENRVQEAEGKITQLGDPEVKWHLVGHLQSNKARRAVALFKVIHSVDSVDIARKLDRHCAEENKSELPVLIQIDLAGEENKTGIDPRNVDELLETLQTCSHLQLHGLMTLPPYFDDPACARPFFKTLRELRDDLRARGAFGDLPGELSMGMTHDFEIAIEEGATMIRVGTALFGERRESQTE